MNELTMNDKIKTSEAIYSKLNPGILLIQSKLKIFLLFNEILNFIIIIIHYKLIPQEMFSITRENYLNLLLNA